jgi:hypothetical protein
MMISIAVRQYGVQPPNQPMLRTGRADAPRRPIEEGTVPAGAKRRSSPRAFLCATHASMTGGGRALAHPPRPILTVDG